jgi:putative ABC transport system permease protein
MLINYLRIAARILARNKLYTFINVLGLGLGVCGCIVIWLVGSYELSFDRSHPDGDRIYRVVQGGKPGPDKDANVIPPMPGAMRAGIPGLESIATYFTFDQGGEVRVPVAGKVDQGGEVRAPGAGKGEQGAQVAKAAKVVRPRLPGEYRATGIIIADTGWFHVFSYQWLAGSPAIALTKPYQVVLTESAVKRYFGNIQPVAAMGRELIYGDSLHVHVSGVVRDWTAHSDLAYTDIISFPTIDASFLRENHIMNDWIPHQGMGRWYWPFAYVKLAKGVATGQVEAQMGRIAAEHGLSGGKDPWLQTLQPLSDLHFNSDYHDNRRKAHLPTLYALTGIALFILLLAIVNFVNLATAQSLQRAKEIGVRKVLGSGRRGLVIQFLTETGALTVVAMVIAMLLVLPVMRFFQEYIPIGVQFTPFTPVNLIFLSGVTVVVTLLAGFYPARVLAGYQPVQTLKGSGSIKGGEKWWLRRGLVVFQFTISLVFIIVTLVIGHQIRYMLQTDYGFRTDAVVTVQAQGNMLDTTISELKLLKQRYSELPGVSEVILEATPPIGWGRMDRTMKYKGKQVVEFTPNVEYAEERFIPFYGMRMVAGRNIRQSDSVVEFVVNEMVTRELGFRQPADAIGKFLYLDDKAVPIVGVVADYHEASFQEPIQSMVIGAHLAWQRDLGVRLASTGKSIAQVKSTLDAMEKIYKEVYPGIEFPYAFMDDSIRDLYEDEQKTASLVQVAMGLAILISCMGLFGLSLFTAERRGSEIGIRKVLGATTVDIAVMLNRQFIRLVLLALVIASPIAWMLANRWLQNFAYRVTVDAWVFVLAGLGAIGLALATVSYQSIRAALTNPVKSLKAE